MTKRSRAFALKGAASVVAALAVAGCSQTSASSKSNLTVNGGTLSIVVSVPPNLKSDPVAQDVLDAEKLAFLAHRNEVKDYKLALLSGTAPKISDNARAAIETDSAIAYIGEIAPGASDQTVGITNALDMLQVSPTDTGAELTQNHRRLREPLRVLGQLRPDLRTALAELDPGGHGADRGDEVLGRQQPVCRS